MICQHDIVAIWVHRFDDEGLQDAYAAGSQDRAPCEGAESCDAPKADGVTAICGIENSAFHWGLARHVLFQRAPDFLDVKVLADLPRCSRRMQHW